MAVNISTSIQSETEEAKRAYSGPRTEIKRLFRHTARGIAPRKIPVHPVWFKKAAPSPISPKRPLIRVPGLGGLCSLTWAIEPPSSGDVEHGAGDGEQDPRTVFPVEPSERARGVGREEECGGMRARHPRVARLELGRGLAGDGRGWHDDALEEV